MRQSKKYSENLDILLALVSNLALTNYKSRTPTNLAKFLHFNKEDVVSVLNGFPGIFRQSTDPSEEEGSEGDYSYTLHMRYARWWTETHHNNKAGDNVKPPEPLDFHYLGTLITFITTMVEQEQSLSRQVSINRWTFLGVWVAAATAIVAALISLAN